MQMMLAMAVAIATAVIDQERDFIEEVVRSPGPGRRDITASGKLKDTRSWMMTPLLGRIDFTGCSDPGKLNVNTQRQTHASQ